MLTKMSPFEARLKTRELGDVVRAAWRRGWQPADLHRVALRNADAVAVQVLGDALAAAVAQHAEATVDGRWPSQLEEMEAEVWWPRHTDHLTARAQQVPDGWAAVARALAQLFGLLPNLPALEKLGPLPGEGQGFAADETAANVDEKMLVKVRMLLAKAESSTYEAEAESFTTKAQELMARHSIDQAIMARQLADGGNSGTPRGGPRAMRLGVQRPYEEPKASLVTAVATANRCSVVWHRELGCATVVGFDVDLRAVELLYTSLLVQATASMRAEGARLSSAGRSRTRSFRSTFLYAFAQRIAERLMDAAEGQAEEAAREEGVGGGGEVAVVLADRAAAVEEATRERFPHTVKKEMGAKLDAEGWHRGRASADQAKLGAVRDSLRAPR